MYQFLMALSMRSKSKVSKDRRASNLPLTERKDFITAFHDLMVSVTISL